MAKTKTIADRLLKRSEVLEMLNLSYPTLLTRIRRGEFPRGIDDGGAMKWWLSDVESYIASLPRQVLS